MVLFMLGEEGWSMSGLQGYGVSLRLHFSTTGQQSRRAAMGCVGVLTLLGAAAGACGDLPQLLLPQPLESVSFQDSACLPGRASVQHSFLTMWHD